MTKHQAVIIGAGFSGLCMGIKLKQAGFHDFVILDKAASLGGTWRDNTYPGAECDVASALYSYSFEQNSDWEYKWAGQKQILQYQQGTAEKYELADHFRFNHKVVKAAYDDKEKVWLIRCDSGQEYRAQYLIPAVGQLHIPNIPKLKGASEFSGSQFHSAEWKHDIELQDKRVAVIGSAASAVQFIPAIAEQAKQLTIFQRSANWVMPKVERPYTAWEQRLSRKVALLAKINRFSVWTLGEWLILPALNGNRVAKWIVSGMCRRHLENNISDPELRKTLTPTYTLGAKRILITDHFYPALERENVHLQTNKIGSINKSGIALENEEQLDFDAIIYATGFQTNPFLASIEISGAKGLPLTQHWQHGAHAYLGLTTHGFPNMFMMYGPNTNLGHTSIIIMIEAQANFIVQAMQGLLERGREQIEVKQEVEASYNLQLQERLSKTAFNQISKSWYKDGNRITNNWAGGTREYRRRLNKIDWSCYSLG